MHNVCISIVADDTITAAEMISSVNGVTIVRVAHHEPANDDDELPTIVFACNVTDEFMTRHADIIEPVMLSYIEIDGVDAMTPHFDYDEIAQ